MADVKILKRGGVYITPLKHKHFDQIENNLSPESVEELKIMGYEVRDALEEMQETAQAFVIKKDDGEFLGVTGLSHFNSPPQLFAMFSSAIRDNFVSLARGSRMLMGIIDAQEETTTMVILAKHDIMIQWAGWLGYEMVGLFESKDNQYVQFVRCICPSCHDGTGVSRPVMH